MPGSQCLPPAPVCCACGCAAMRSRLCMLQCVCKYQQIILIGICLSSVKCTQYTLFPPRTEAAKKPTPPMAPPMFICWLGRGGTGGLGENHPPHTGRFWALECWKRQMERDQPSHAAWTWETVLGDIPGFLLIYLHHLHPGPCRGTEFWNLSTPALLDLGLPPLSLGFHL